MTFQRIEPETETHRTEKALQTIVHSARLPLAKGHVLILVPAHVAATPGGQRLVTLLVHLLARMKGIIRRVSLQADDAPVVPGVPLRSERLLDGFSSLVERLSGPESKFRCNFETSTRAGTADVTISVGTDIGEVVIGADGWRALAGEYVNQAVWDDPNPIGPYLAAVIAASEAFKRLLNRNYGWNEGRLVVDTAFSLFNFGVNEQAAPGPSISSVHLHDMAVAGAGAGGTAALYTLLSFPAVTGEVAVVEPGFLKVSNLGRYLMTDYDQVHQGLHKLESVKAFARSFAPALSVHSETKSWDQVEHSWQTVLATVDTPEARRDIQRSNPPLILDAGVVGMVYAVLRVIEGGWCLECKHPFDPDLTWKRRALRWGLTVEDVTTRYRDRVPISRADIERLALVQGRPMDTYDQLIGLPFDEAPALTECGETPLSLAVPSQAPVLPMATTAAGIVLAAEVVKEMNGLGSPLHNYLTQDLRFTPKDTGHRFKPRTPTCAACRR